MTDAETVVRQLPDWIAHHDEIHARKALGFRSPREFIRLAQSHEGVRSFGGGNNTVTKRELLRSQHNYDIASRSDNVGGRASVAMAFPCQAVTMCPLVLTDGFIG